jgi:hypothetical protein
MLRSTEVHLDASSRKFIDNQKIDFIAIESAAVFPKGGHTLRQASLGNAAAAVPGSPAEACGLAPPPGRHSKRFEVTQNFSLTNFAYKRCFIYAERRSLTVQALNLVQRKKT